MKRFWLAIGVFLAYMALIPFSYIQGSQAGYDKGFEAGKNYVPPAMQRTDSLSVVYYGNMPMVSNQIKMPRDSVQLIIDSFMGKPRQYLLMT